METIKYDVFIKGKEIDLICLTEEIATKSNWYNWFNDEETTEHLQKHYYPNTKELQREFFNTMAQDGLKDIDFLITPKGRCQSKSTYYVYPLRFIPEIAGVKREEFIKAVNAEGILFYQGYVRPLYLQPMYQKQHLFKNGYPFSAVENRECRKEYSQGTSPNAEKLHFEQMIINEHVRLPHDFKDVNDIIIAIKKIINHV